VTSWQVAPVVAVALVVGIPIGLGVGRFAFARFAQSLAVVDDASISFVAVALLVVAVVIAAIVAVIVATTMTRRNRVALLLREG
jgi:hypothetical protein